MQLHKVRPAAGAASAKLSLAARDQEIRNAIGAGMSLREIETVTGVPRSTVQRIGAATPLTDVEYLRLANAEVLARAEVVALESVEQTLSEAQAVE